MNKIHTGAHVLTIREKKCPYWKTMCLKKRGDTAVYTAYSLI